MPDKKNILFILHLPPPVHGSSIVGQYIKNSTLINDTFECRYINLLVSRSVTETGKTSVLKVFRFVGVWFRLFSEILKKRPDLCYLALSTTGGSFYKDVLLIALLRLFHVKRIYHIHNKGVRQKQSNRINKFLYKFVFSGAVVILLSKYLHKDIETFVPDSNVFICPNGIENTNVETKLVIHPVGATVKILFLSNLIESKGVFVLLDACSILHNKGIYFECDFVGAEGDLNTAQFNERVIQNQLAGHVNYLGKKFGSEKQEIFAKADIFAFPTYYSKECFPLVLLEAMSEGLPLVSTFEGGIPDIVEEGVNGFLVPQQDAKMLAMRLETLINNPELRLKMGNAGRIKFERQFKLDIFEKRIVEILVKGNN